MSSLPPCADSSILNHFARSICLWTTQKKKPIFTQPLAHGFNEVLSETEGLIKTPRWVTSLGSLRYSDIIASGKRVDVLWPSTQS